MDPNAFTSSLAGEVRRVPGSAPYWAFFPGKMLRDLVLSADLVLKLSEADQALGRLLGVGQVLPNPHLVSSAYRLQDAVSSLAIEGTQASLSDVLSSEASDTTRTGEVHEVRNYIRAFDHGLERLGSLPLSLRLVRELHELLMAGVVGLDKTPGEFRRSQNWIGRGGGIEESVFVPPPPEEMTEALDDWEKFLHDEEPRLPPLIRCALVHYQFETIHPFLDGNGRLGRLLISFFLVEQEVLAEPLLYVSSYLEARRSEYYERLQRVRQEGDIEGWCSFFLDAVIAQAIDAVRRAEALLEMVTVFRDRLREGNARGGAVDLVEHLIANPYLTTERAARLLQVSRQGAAYAIQKLMHAGIVEMVEPHGKAHLYLAHEVLDILENPQLGSV